MCFDVRWLNGFFDDGVSLLNGSVKIIKYVGLLDEMGELYVEILVDRNVKIKKY